MKREKRQWTPTEKTMLIATLILFVILAAKSMFFDAFTGETPEESVFIEATKREMAVEEVDFWHKNGLVIDRIVGIKPMSDTEIQELKTNGITSEHYYKAKKRSYFLWIIPFNETYRILNDQERTTT